MLFFTCIYRCETQFLTRLQKVASHGAFIKSIVVLCKSCFLISKNRFSYIRKYSQMIFFLNIRLLYFDIQNSICLKAYIRKWFLIIYYSNFELQKHAIFSYASVPSSKLWWLFLCKVVQLKKERKILSLISLHIHLMDICSQNILLIFW